MSTYALAEELKISRTPVIQALKRLESEGLVEIIPQVGCRVIRPGAATVAELYALRGALEGLAAEAAARTIDNGRLTNLQRLCDEVEQAAAQDDETTFEDRNYEFHLAIIEASEMPRVAQTAQGVWSLVRYQLARLPYPSEHMQESVPEHQAIVDALKRHAAKRARAAVEHHAARGGERFVELLKHPADANHAGMRGAA
jgi:DNA-binding GntR family transcriptional regulator